jgi:hypothetical protein
MQRTSQVAHSANFCLSVALATLVGLVLTACAAANPSSDERGPAKCPVHIGQSETEFLRCGCFWPYFADTPGVYLLSQAETASGVARVYRCQLKGAYGHAVTVVNGTVTEIAGPTR